MRKRLTKKSFAQIPTVGTVGAVHGAFALFLSFFLWFGGSGRLLLLLL